MNAVFTTADLCDRFAPELDVAEPLFRDFGGLESFEGAIATVKVYEDNVLVRRRLEEPGEGRVLVIDGAGSRRVALVGDQLAKLGADHGWSGLIVYGCVRDSRAMGSIQIGVKALATHPLKSSKRGIGELDLPVSFAGVTFRLGDHVYADADGIVVARRSLDLAQSELSPPREGDQRS